MFCLMMSLRNLDIRQAQWEHWERICAVSWDFQQRGILTCVDSDEPVQPPFKLRNSKFCSVSGLTVIKYSSDKLRLWSDCAYAQADLRLCWSYIPHCWKSHALAHMSLATDTLKTLYRQDKYPDEYVFWMQSFKNETNVVCLLYFFFSNFSF